MTLHTKAATNDILDIFNQPLRNIGLQSNQPESAGESDYDDDDYTSAGESTGTGRISGPSEFGDEEPDARNTVIQEEADNVSGSPWSDFTASKHVPKLDLDNATERDDGVQAIEQGFVVLRDNATISWPKDEDVVTPVSPDPGNASFRNKFIPLPPKDYEAPNGPFWDPSQTMQNRLPFMTPIVEKTESSIGIMTIQEDKDCFSSKTPSRSRGDRLGILETHHELLGSPFQEIVNDANANCLKAPKSPNSKSLSGKSGPVNQKVKPKKPAEPIIKDIQCNPVDESIRNFILDNLEPPLSSYTSFFDHRPQTFNKGPEIRKFVKALSKAAKGGTDKTNTNICLPPSLEFPISSSSTYTVKRELGKGAFAPVYLVQQETDPNLRPHIQQEQAPQPRHLALKCEHPPTAWEFYIMSTLHSRLPNLPPSVSQRSPILSLLVPHELHLFADEGYLFEQYLDQGTLLNLVNLAKPDPAGVLDEAIAMFFTVELLRTVESMHAVGILHGDLKADNCLVRLGPTGPDPWDPEYHATGAGGWAHKGLCLIDFGRGIDLRCFEPGVRFIADWKTGKADCAEMREMRPWTWQVDYWGVAGVAHSLLFGKYIEDMAVDVAPITNSGNNSSTITQDPNAEAAAAAAGAGPEMSLPARARKWKIKEPLKRYWQTDLWAPLFDALLNPAAHVSGEEHGRMPISRTLRACREAMEAWLEREAGRKGVKAGLRRLEERVRGGRGR